MAWQMDAPSRMESKQAEATNATRQNNSGAARSQSRHLESLCIPAKNDPSMDGYSTFRDVSVTWVPFRILFFTMFRGNLPAVRRVELEDATVNGRDDKKPGCVKAAETAPCKV